MREKCPYSDFFWSVFSPNAGKYGPENRQIHTLLTKLLANKISAVLEGKFMFSFVTDETGFKCLNPQSSLFDLLFF